jgi:hypothetical protein
VKDHRMKMICIIAWYESLLTGGRLLTPSLPSFNPMASLSSAHPPRRKNRDTTCKIAPHVGKVRSMLRLFDEVVKCDKDGVLKGVREAVEGK